MRDASSVSNRTLQRARLGELDERELAELLERLRLEGGTDRLEHAIEADHQFLLQHPVEQMTPLIRDRLERRRRASHDQGEGMLSITNLLRRPTTLLAATTLVGAAFAFTQLESWPEPASTAAGASPAALASNVPLSARVDRRLSPLNELVISPGYPLTVDGRGIDRVEVDLPNVVPSPTISEDTRTMRFVGGESGLTGVRFHYEDGPSDLFYIRVAPFHSADEVLAGGVSSEMPSAHCDELATSKNLRGQLVVRVLTTPIGNVGTAYVERSTLGPADDVERCVIGEVLQARFSPTDEPRTALLEFDYP